MKNFKIKRYQVIAIVLVLAGAAYNVLAKDYQTCMSNAKSERQQYQCWR